MFMATIRGILVAFCVTIFVAGTATAQPSAAGKHFSDYKGIAIGMKTDDVRSKLGNPKDKSDTMDLYVFSDSESAQFYYDPAKVVTAMMITYSGDLTKAPSVKDVLGEDAELKPDGGVFKMIRFPKAGYWISYNRTGGNDAIVNIAFQKI
jgi:hypothetical protein